MNTKLFFLLLISFTVFNNPSFSQYTVSTYTGNGSPGTVNGPLATATFNHPFSMCRDKWGNIFVSDADNNCIRKITKDSVFTYAGTGVAGWKDTLAAFSQFRKPAGICVDDTGNVYVADFENQRIRKILVNGWVTTIAGTGVAGYQDGPFITAQFNYPRGITINKIGEIYIGDSWNHVIRKTNPSGGFVGTIAGGAVNTGVGSVGSWLDGQDTSARFYTPCGLSIDSTGNVYIADAYNHRIRKLDINGDVTTLAGNGPSGTTAGGFVNGGSSISELDTPTELFYSEGNQMLYIGDSYNHSVRALDGSGNLSTLAGTGSAGFGNGSGATAAFDFTRGIVSNANGDSIWVNDYNNHAVRLLVPDSLVVVEEQDEFSFRVFPNPAENEIFVEAENGKVFSYSISDVAGKKVKEGNSVGRIDISEIERGMYFLEVRNEKREVVRIVKVMKGE